ncbi:MAG TPA: hypothetical protein VFF14_07905, partial [Candidatus Deferrimicrobium sp.]|nr:hypothetical protein [Candidatus Deferrimicrobium sp.]
MFTILLVIALIIFAVLRERNSKNQYKGQATLSLGQSKHEELARVNFLLSEIESWELQCLVDRELAQKLSQKYKEQKDMLCGITPSTPPKNPLAQETVNHNPDSIETLPDPILDMNLYEGKQETPSVALPLEILPETHFEPSKPHFNLFNFLQEKNIKWFNALGTLMLLAAGIIFVATNWESWNGLIKSVIMVL